MAAGTRNGDATSSRHGRRRLRSIWAARQHNVQPTNAKLIDRAERIIVTVTGLPRTAATRLLEDSGGSVRTAIVMGKLKVSREEAERRLAACGGRVRQTLGGGA